MRFSTSPPRFLSFKVIPGKFGCLKVVAILMFIVFSAFIPEDANAVEVVITGPTTVCPKNGTLHTYTAKSYEIPFGFEVDCGVYDWAVIKNGIVIEERTLYGGDFTYRFEDIGEYQIHATSSQCDFLFSGGTTSITVNSRVVIPNPIIGPVMCFSGQPYTFTTSPSLASQNPYGSDCYYHFAYLWTAPSGWSIDGVGNTAFTGDTVEIAAPVNTPAGSYIISVQGSIPYGGPPFENNSWFSSPRNYTVQVGPFSTSQVGVSGTEAVCNGNPYTYTATMPGGHQNGYTYSWTYPSGWIEESTSLNTIRLYVPSYNSSYGPVSVSINNGCGSTPFTGITVYPCSYMMSTGNFQVYPNPSFGELNVEYFVEEDSSKTQYDTEQPIEEKGSNKKVFRIEIFDKSEQLVKSAESKDGKIHLDTKGLRPGSYFLHIYYDKEILREQILIQ